MAVRQLRLGRTRGGHRLLRRGGGCNIAAPAAVQPCAGAAVYLFLLSIGELLLRDADSFWQIKVGQWIIDHGAMPYTDIYSFTRFGEPWISSSWLS